MLHYSIKPHNLGAHLLAVSITIPAGARGEAILAKLPKWIPGSYKIRDYSRFVQRFQARTESGEVLNWQKRDSDTWAIEPSHSAIVIDYEVYAYDLSVRGSYLDDQRLFFNHCCICFDITDFSNEPRSIAIESPNNWPIFTTLPIDETTGHYFANSYHHQIDCPVESAANYLYREFTLQGIRHEMVFTGTLSDDYDLDRLAKNLEQICAVEMQLFEGTPLNDRYLFMTYLEANQYGGLEHLDSTALIASPDMMPKKGQPDSEKVINFYGLCSHEYFHLWNVKRLQPKDFMPYDLYREQHTEMLWAFEGFTSYYDELLLLRADVINAKTFLTRQAKNLTRVLSTPGRHLQSIAESSFDAWTKLYQADNNSLNNMVSYYAKGAVFALYLDLFLRKYSNNQSSLDDVMRHLWYQFGEKHIGISENDVFIACAQLLPAEHHVTLAEVFVTGIHGTEDLPLETLLVEFGVSYLARVKMTKKIPHTSDSGMRLSIKDSLATISFLDANSHAAKSGLSVGDEIFAINGQNVSSSDIDHLLSFSQPNERVTLTACRRGRVFDKAIQLHEPMANQIHLTQKHETPLGNSWLTNSLATRSDAFS